MKCVHVRRECVGGGTGKDMTDDNQKQGSEKSGGIKVTWRRNIWKPREVVSREEETTIGKEEGESTESRRKVQQYTGTRKKETLDPGKRIGSKREGNSNHNQKLNTDRETQAIKGLVMQQRAKKGTRDDATLSRRECEPMDRCIAAEASSN
jgi:hypothetical protein